MDDRGDRGRKSKGNYKLGIINYQYFLLNLLLMKETLIKLIQQIPYGRVVSYGALAEQINILTDMTTSGWMVGRLLSSMSPREWKYDAEYPWWRVINKQ